MDYLRARAGLDESRDDLDIAVFRASLPDPATAEAPPPEPQPAGPPLTRETFIQQAEQAQARGEWSEAERIWKAVRAELPQIWAGYTGGATALAGLGRFDEARPLLAEGAVMFPHERAFPLEQGRLAMRLGDWAGAETHWRTALTFDVKPWWVYSELAGALEQQGRIADAESVLAEARAQSDERDAITLYTYPATLALKREDWAGALAWWAEARRRFPEDQSLPARHHEALLQLAEHDPVAYHAALRESVLSLYPDDPGEALALRFESLGGTGPDGGCEFGCFQRSFGAEPLALFRWAAVPASSLIACLDARFARIGDTDAITVEPHEGQWEITDTIYGTKMHSFVSSIDVSAERMQTLAGKRMRYLREKLIGDLTAPEKIFVLKAGWSPPTDEEIAALGRGVRSYGPGELLCVCPADEAHPEGVVRSAGTGVFIGYMDFSAASDVAARRPAWEKMCRTIVSLSALSRPGQPTPCPFHEGGNPAVRKRRQPKAGKPPGR
jgi:tetratricopeptide (TPR) repeat protein